MRKIIRVGLGIMLALLLLLVVFRLLARPRPEHPFFRDRPDVLVIAHQGGEELRPSNTMVAYRHAVELGVDVLEMDMHSTADGVLVLSHDDTVDRLTDGSGRIKDMTWQELQTLDAGYRWSEDGASFPYRGQGITIPALEEVFSAFPDVPLVIEIKQQEPPIVTPFCALIREYGREEDVLVASFHPDTMRAFRETCPEVATSGTEVEIRPFYVLNRLRLASLYTPPAEAFQVPEYSGNLHVVTAGFVRAAHGRNVDVHVWTVNETADMERLLALGVDGGDDGAAVDEA
ncbi:MAG: glycerophosphodiester phosphodiesterase, partial [Anaerolineae bacterium]|nr:glycerophosphodiester phosphodiesterase [Anaerolineae bacterium]